MSQLHVKNPTSNQAVTLKTSVNLFVSKSVKTFIYEASRFKLIYISFLSFSFLLKSYERLSEINAYILNRNSGLNIFRLTCIMNKISQNSNHR